MPLSKLFIKKVFKGNEIIPSINFIFASQTSFGTRFFATIVQPTSSSPSPSKTSSSKEQSSVPKSLPDRPIDDFMSGTAANYIEDMYIAYKKDPLSVHVSWRSYFRSLDAGYSSRESFAIPPMSLNISATTNPTPSIPGTDHVAPTTLSFLKNIPAISPSTTTELNKLIEDHMKVQLLIRAYQVRGHLKANIDPLGIMQPERDFSPAPELEPSYYGFTEIDMDRPFQLGAGVLPAFRKEHSSMTLREILDALKRIYCGTIGYEYTHIPDRAQCDWLRTRIEVVDVASYSSTSLNSTTTTMTTPSRFTLAQQRTILDRLTWADSFERFVAQKYPSEKRFGLEGGESLIPGLKFLIDRVVEEDGIEHIVMGMAHRGRLNVLANVVRKPIESIFSEFSGVMTNAIDDNDEDGVGRSYHSGDVKYHLGMNYVRPTPRGKQVNLSLVANPSHLEAADPVVLGKTRALQLFLGDIGKHSKAMALLIHGDAAFAGQGVVYETMGLSMLPHYGTGGTIHVIINNQIGFTTDPRFSRSTPYCSDLAKTINAPIIHVNSDDVEAVVHVFLLAGEWRSIFRKDVVIDLVCYRKHGHNEMDQPAFTQPRMYKAITKKISCHEMYKACLLESGKNDNNIPVFDATTDQQQHRGAITREEIEGNQKKVWEFLGKAYDASKYYKPTSKDWLTSNWTGFMSPKELQEKIAPARPTGVSKDILMRVGISSSTIPEKVDGGEFIVHPGVKRIMEARIKSLKTGMDIDMPTAEALAFGTLLLEGNHVRLSGQDVERGTFSQRHAVIHNQSLTHEEIYIPLAHIDEKQAPVVICNSSLSEYGVLGFELGYSLVSPHALICWEAQFGDFANGAQVMIDQFISSGERKWLQRSGLTMILPHGYDGAGPEHSNGRIERFLSLCDDHSDTPVPSDDGDQRTRQAQDCNLQVVYPSTPANYFHVLRRQIHRDFRKPLVLFNSKSLLRHPMARSTLKEMTEGTRFTKLYPAMQFLTDDYHKDLTSANVATTMTTAQAKKVERLIFCSGQVFYTLVKALYANSIKLRERIAIARIEQISPFPYAQFLRECDRFPAVKHIVWCQEEPINLGMWTYVEPRIEAILRRESKWHAGKRAEYAGREPTAAVATGYKKLHVAEEFSFLAGALLGTPDVKPIKVDTGAPVWKID